MATSITNAHVEVYNGVTYWYGTDGNPIAYQVPGSAITYMTADLANGNETAQNKSALSAGMIAAGLALIGFYIFGGK